MVNIAFLQRWVNPESPAPRPLTYRNPDQWSQGSVTLQDGYFYDEQGKRFTYATVRVLTVDPIVADSVGKINRGYHGLDLLNFTLGRAGIRVRPATSNILTTSSRTHQFVKGRCGIVLAGLPDVGALTEFGIWPSTLSDPRDFYVETATNLVSGGVAEPSNQHSMVFVPRRDARYLAVGSKVYNFQPQSSGNGAFYHQKFLLEKAPDGATVPTTPYSQAREVRVKVNPDRLNRSVNPNFAIDVTNWTGVVRTARGSGWVGVDSGTVVTHTIPSLIIGRTYTASVYVDSTAVNDITPTVTSGGTALASSGLQSLSGTPLRVWIKFVATATTVVLTFTSTAATNSFYQCLVEEGTAIGSYFDGSWSADTIWETGGVTGKARSYLYKNRAERYSAIRRILSENVPMGIGIALPVMGTLPTN